VCKSVFLHDGGGKCVKIASELVGYIQAHQQYQAEMNKRKNHRQSDYSNKKYV